MVIDRYELEWDLPQDTCAGRRDRGESRPRGQRAMGRRQNRRKATAIPGGIHLRRKKRWSW